MKKFYLPLPRVLLMTLTLLLYTIPAFTQTRELDSFMLAASHARAFNGVVLIARHDSILLHKGYGFRDAEKKIPHDTNSLFQIGSLSKSFTAACIMQQVEKGVLQLDDPLGKFFPFYAVGANVTVKQLLNHTGGIYECSGDDAFMASIYTGHLTEVDFWARFGPRPLDFVPGTQFKYSNTGYMMLGYLLQKVTGRSYWSLVRTGIFKPAQMDASGFDFAANKNPTRSIGYESLYQGLPERARIVDSSYSFAAGAVYSNSGDLYRYQKALLEGEIVSAVSLETMFTPALNHYGSGWIIDTLFGQKVIMHEGAIPGFFALEAIIPGEQETIILLGNKRDGGIRLTPLYFSLLQLLHNAPYLLPRLKIKLPPDSLRQYTGDYQLADKPSFAGHITLREGHTWLQWNKDPPIELFAEKEDFFFTTAYDMQLSFTRGPGPHGAITGFTATVAGKSYIYQRQP